MSCHDYLYRGKSPQEISRRWFFQQCGVGLGAIALTFALALPRGIWGEIERRTGLRLLPVGYRLDIRQVVTGK